MSADGQRLNECPLCGSRQLRWLDEFAVSVSSDSRSGCGVVHNAVCSDCGVVFNASGTRFNLSEFYSERYQLLSESTLAEFVYKAENAVTTKGINDQMIDAVFDQIKPNRVGRMLEVGCGKGLFLRKFKDRFPDWEVCAIEPSRNAQSFLSRMVPEARAEFCSFQDSRFASEQFDLVVSIGVLEHVPDPVGFCRSLRQCLKPNGACFISVPNFEENPSDLITFDHLTRFTPWTLNAVIARAEMTVKSIHASKIVPMWAIAVAANFPTQKPHKDPRGDEVARAASRWMRGAFETYDQMALASPRHASVALYGTGIVGLAAPDNCRLSVDSISCFVEDNVHLHGAERLGRPIISLDALRSDDRVTELSFSANPCYLKQMEVRARAVLGDKVRIWSLPDLKEVE